MDHLTNDKIHTAAPLSAPPSALLARALIGRPHAALLPNGAQPEAFSADLRGTASKQAPVHVYGSLASWSNKCELYYLIIINCSSPGVDEISRSASHGRLHRLFDALPDHEEKGMTCLGRFLSRYLPCVWWSFEKYPLRYQVVHTVHTPLSPFFFSASSRLSLSLSLSSSLILATIICSRHNNSNNSGFFCFPPSVLFSLVPTFFTLLFCSPLCLRTEDFLPLP